MRCNIIESYFPHQIKPLHIIGCKVDYMTDRDLADGHLTQSQHLRNDTAHKSSQQPTTGSHSTLSYPPLLLPPLLLPPPSVQQYLTTLTYNFDVSIYLWFGILCSAFVQHSDKSSLEASRSFHFSLYVYMHIAIQWRVSHTETHNWYLNIT